MDKPARAVAQALDDDLTILQINDQRQAPAEQAEPTSEQRIAAGLLRLTRCPARRLALDDPETSRASRRARRTDMGSIDPN
jgi:hypothetical protein